MKTNTRNAAHLNSSKLFKIATQNGAQSLGLSSRVGQLKSGFWADFLIIDLEAIGLKGNEKDELLDSLVFGCGNGGVKKVFVGGIER